MNVISLIGLFIISGFIGGISYRLQDLVLPGTAYTNSAPFEAVSGTMIGIATGYAAFIVAAVIMVAFKAIRRPPPENDMSAFLVIYLITIVSLTNPYVLLLIARIWP